MATAAVFVYPSPAGAATTVGQTGPPGECGPGYAMTQASTGAPPTYTVPDDGVITSFTAGATGLGEQTKLLILERMSATDYRVAAKGEFATFTTTGLQTFETQVPVRAGQQIGLYGYICVIAPVAPGDMVVYSAIAEPAVGADVSFTSAAAARANVSAQLEPDCDRDGLGDETQDQDLRSCPPAPTTTITKAPKDKVKTKRKKKAVTFEFNANEPGATFNCVLDGQQEFRTCTSPLTVKVKKGEHTLVVTATDVGGNTGPPASDTWKVKRKKKK